MKLFPLFILLLLFTLQSCDLDFDNNYSIPSQRLQVGIDSAQTLDTFLEDIAGKYPDITYLEPMGTSLEDRTINALVISDNPSAVEQEPRLRITGAIHGDETVTTDVIIRFIDYIVRNYESSAYIKSIVDDRYMVFIPALNPDGINNETRYNANGVDLNRNFSTQWSPGAFHGDAPFSEPESIALRDYSEFMGFHLSITYHAGAVIVNMPFDYASLNEDGIAPAEYSLVTLFGETYTTSGRFLETEGLLNDINVTNGTINGGDWYKVTGSLQDWSYLETGCIDYTIEISNDKSPDTRDEIRELYELNRDSLLAFIDKAGIGVYGSVVNAADEPVSAEITIAGGDIITRSDEYGYYHRVLEPGSYSITYSAAGYSSFIDSVNITAGTPSIQRDIIMTAK